MTGGDQMTTVDKVIYVMTNKIKVEENQTLRFEIYLPGTNLQGPRVIGTSSPCSISFILDTNKAGSIDSLLLGIGDTTELNAFLEKILRSEKLTNLQDLVE